MKFFIKSSSPFCSGKYFRYGFGSGFAVSDVEKERPQIGTRLFYLIKRKMSTSNEKIIDKNLISANTNKNFPVKTCGLCKLIK